MALYTLNVAIAPADFEVLKGSGYNLCLGKVVNGKVTVVWSGNTEYLTEDSFQWKEEYQVFAQNTFTVGALVEADTGPQDIQSGQTCTIDSNGDMGAAQGPIDESGSFIVENDYGEICPGVNCNLNGNFSPIFVSDPIVKGPATFTPIVTVVVWFSTTETTSTMIFDAKSYAFVIEYETGQTTRAVMYQNETWSEAS